MKDIQVINYCEVCCSNSILEVLDLGEHPLCDDLISIGSDKVNTKYPIKVGLCNTCLTSHQMYQVDKVKLFPKNYHYRARFTKDVLDGMTSLKNSVLEKRGSLKNKIVLDIGCNDGCLLDTFKKDGAFTIGVEPTNASKDAEKKGHKIFNNFFDKETAILIKESFATIDFITFTNVFAHIENLKELLENLKIIISENTCLIIENHYLGSILEKNQFDTFYHEHPRTYSLNSFIKVAENLDMTITKYEFPSRYGGNIRVFLENLRHNDKLNLDNQILDKEKLFKDQFLEMNKFLKDWKVKKRAEIIDYVEKYGPMPAKAFPGRAAILIKFLELNENHISAIYERTGSQKIGNYVPSTRIPILDESIFFEKYISSKVILNLAWHISHEIKNYLIKKGFEGKVINILDE